MVPKKIPELVERFQRNLEAYRRSAYNETQVRREFLDPFFKALDWDVDNEQGYAEAYKDVIHEDAIKIAGHSRAPDYSFRVGGVRKFFVEAKKPAINLREDADGAYQLRRYAWSAKLPLSILSNFEELAVYDCRVKPDKADKASHSRVLSLKYTDFRERWEEIAGIFSREAILKGSFDKYAESKKVKKGTAEVDDAFLSEIEHWREMLARNLALRNPGLTPRQLNFAVQLTIDRIIFLRICEDRGIELYGRLMALQNGDRVYKRLFELFNEADFRYNSGLFHFKQEKGRASEVDSLTPNLTIDDKILKDIFKNLYYPDSPYEFSVLPADLLGQVYEQFLGKVIRLTPGHRAVVEYKPEVRKAGGVYYTPTYIVNYIVKKTVGQLLEGRKPGPRKGAGRLKILDPACGSGSFLLGAYQFLLDWHLKAYMEDGPHKWAAGRNPRLYPTAGGGWKLTVSERKRLLLDHIYGVDIDSQAVEVTKLSLLLKILEGEDEQSVGQESMFHRVLPDLGDNIKCGNSLIGPDYYHGRQLSLMNGEETYRINAFDWQTEFPEIMAAGGFDAVIGNPPWGSELSEDELSYLRNINSEIIVRMIDSFMYFVYQGSKKLREGGFFGMILPDVVLYQNDNFKLREFIFNNFSIKSMLNLGDVFDKVSRPSSVIIFNNSHIDNNEIEIANFTKVNKIIKANAILDKKSLNMIKQDFILNIPNLLFITEGSEKYNIFNKFSKETYDILGSFIDDDNIQRGVSPDLKEAFLVDENIIKEYHLEGNKLRKVLTGGIHVKRFLINYPDLWLIYTTRDDNYQQLPNICNYINQFRHKITCKEVKQNKHPLYSLHRSRNENIFLKNDKKIGVVTSDRIIVPLDEYRTFATDGLFLFGVRDIIDIKYLLGILNSKLYVFLYRLLALEGGRSLAQVKATIISNLPIRTIDFNDPADKARHDRLGEMVENMLVWHKQLAATALPQEKTVLQRRIAETDRRIDELVYELYGLSPEEIRLVEGVNVPEPQVENEN